MDAEISVLEAKLSTVRQVKAGMMPSVSIIVRQLLPII
jgi:hypothetical protein